MKGKILFTLLLLCGTAALVLNPQEPIPREYEIKALMLARFPIYIHWPESSGVYDKSKPFVIGVIGENPFDGMLEQTLAGQKILDKKGKIKFFTSPEEISGCDILFIAGSAEPDLRIILDTVKNKPILTVGDTPGFAQKGVIINLYIEEGQAKFEINVRALFHASLMVDHRMLKLARIVN